MWRVAWDTLRREWLARSVSTSLAQTRMAGTLCLHFSISIIPHAQSSTLSPARTSCAFIQPTPSMHIKQGKQMGRTEVLFATAVTHSQSSQRTKRRD